jgi:hypothetical protein
LCISLPQDGSFSQEATEQRHPVTDSSTTLVFSLSTIVQVLLPVILTGLGAISWFVKRMVARLESDIEDQAEALAALETRCDTCRTERQKEHACQILANGKIISRISHIEGRMGNK